MIINKSQWIHRITAVLLIAMIGVAATVQITPAAENSSAKKSENTSTSLKEAQQEKAALEKALEDAKQTINELKESKGDVQEKVNDLNTQLMNISSQITALENQLAQKNQELTEKKDQIEDTKSQLEDAKKQEEQQYADMKVRIQFMYENGDTQMLDLILSSKSVGDFLNKAEYISEISSYDRKMLNKMKETKQEIADTQVALEDSKTNLENLQTKLSKQKSDLQILSDAKEKEMEEYNNLIAAGKKSKDNIDDEISNQKQVIQEMESIEKAREEAARKAALAAQNANKSTGQSSASTGVTQTKPNTDKQCRKYTKYRKF